MTGGRGGSVGDQWKIGGREGLLTRTKPAKQKIQIYIKINSSEAKESQGVFPAKWRSFYRFFMMISYGLDLTVGDAIL